MIQVRRVQPQDMDELLKNMKDLDYEQKLMSTRLENMMIVIDNREICGIGFYVNFNKLCILNWVHIRENSRRNRLGTILVKTMLNAAEQEGALQAYLTGECDDFAEFLGFEQITDSAEIKELNKIYSDLYKTDTKSKLYKVSLLDYFKPCSENKNCR